MAHALDGDRRRLRGPHSVHHAGLRFRRRSARKLSADRQMTDSLPVTIRDSRCFAWSGTNVDTNAVLPRMTERRHYCREIATPQGSSPTWIVLMTLRLVTSMTDTSFDTPLVVRRYLSSGVNAMCHTR